MDEKPRILRLHYRSRRALAADHAAYWVHGGMVVPSSSEGAPPLNTPVSFEVRGPDGLCIRVAARIGRTAPGQGFLVSFEPGTEASRAALDAALARPEFTSARDAEGPELMGPPEVALVDPSEATDPAVPRPFIEPSAAGPTSAAAASRAPPEAPSPGEGPPPASPRPAAAAVRPPSTIRGARPRAFSERRPPPDPDRTVIRRARPGEQFLTSVVRYPTVRSYMSDAEALEATARLELEAPEVPPQRNDPVFLKLTLPGHNVIEIWTVIEAVSPGRVTLRFNPDDERYRRACLYLTSHQARNRRERESERGETDEERSVLWVTEQMAEEAEKMPIRRRIKRMGMEDKINLALSGNREERMALAQDSNRAIHHHLLRNAKLTIDEVAFMSRLTTLNPDVLDKIAENPGYTQNPAVTKALVFNPRTPLRTAIRLLDRLPRSDLNILSRRTGMNKRLVMKAKDKLQGAKW